MDIVTPLKVGERMYVGGAAAKPGPGWAVVDVRVLPESPRVGAEIPMPRLRDVTKQVVDGWKAGKTVLVRCKHGVSRSPTVAKLALRILNKPFSDHRYFPSGAWKQVRL